MSIDTDKLKQISIVDWLSKNGYKRQRGSGKWVSFYSPFSPESNASFKVDVTCNKWVDFHQGVTKKEDIIELVKMIENCSFQEACAILAKDKDVKIKEYTPIKAPSGIKIHSVGEITDKEIIDYFTDKRKISVNILKRYCKSVDFSFPYSEKDPNKIYTAAGFPNSLGGYDLRNSFLKVATAPKVFSKIKGKSKNRDVVNIFEGFTNMLSALVYWGVEEFKYDTYCLNGTAQMNVLKPMLDGKKINFFCDNDKAGDRLLDGLSDFDVVDCRYIFEWYNDFNSFLVDQSSGDQS